MNTENKTIISMIINGMRALQLVSQDPSVAEPAVELTETQEQLPNEYETYEIYIINVMVKSYNKNQ